MGKTGTGGLQDDWEIRFARAFPTLKILLEFYDVYSVGFRVTILLRDFIRMELRLAREERAKEMAEIVRSYANYLRPIEGDMMHNEAVERLKQFRAEEINQLEE